MLSDWTKVIERSINSLLNVHYLFVFLYDLTKTMIMKRDLNDIKPFLIKYKADYYFSHITIVNLIFIKYYRYNSNQNFLLMSMMNIETTRYRRLISMCCTLQLENLIITCHFREFFFVPVCY
jgi:hypothetical protein